MKTPELVRASYHPRSDGRERALPNKVTIFKEGSQPAFRNPEQIWDLLPLSFARSFDHKDKKQFLSKLKLSVISLFPRNR